MKLDKNLTTLLSQNTIQINTNYENQNYEEQNE